LLFIIKLFLPAAVSTAAVVGAAAITASGPTAPVATRSTPVLAATWPAAAEAAATPVAGLCARPSFVDGHVAALELFAIQTGNRCLSFTLFGHLDESETARFACELIFDDCHRSYFAKFFERLPDILFGNGEWQIPHIYIHRSPLFFYSS
jgi:hypothetical protein